MTWAGGTTVGEFLWVAYLGGGGVEAQKRRGRHDLPKTNRAKQTPFKPWRFGWCFLSQGDVDRIISFNRTFKKYMARRIVNFNIFSLCY